MLQRLFQNNMLLPFVLFLVALLPRVYELDQTTIYPDEVSWIVRGKEAVYALLAQNLDYFEFSVWWNSDKESESIGLPLALTSAASYILLGQGTGDASLNLLPDYIAARVPQAIFSALFIPLFYVLAKELFSKKIALVSSLLLVADPVHIGLSRWVINDPLLTAFTFLSIAFYVLGHKKASSIYLALAGVFLAFGFLTKPQGFFPAVSWLVYSVLVSYRLSKSIGFIIFSLLVSLLVILIIWPASWLAPLTSIADYIYRQLYLSSIGIAYYFFGQVLLNPPWYVYLFGIAIKLPLLAFIALVSSPFLFLVAKKKGFVSLENNAVIFSSLAFCLLILIFVSLSNLNQGVRYILPLWPWIYLLIAWSIITLGSFFKDKLAIVGIFTLVLLGNLVGFVSYHPEHTLFYNSLVGGASGAQRFDLVGRCHGVKGAIEIVEKCYPGLKSIAILGCFSVTAPYYYTGEINTDWEKERVVVVENSFKQLLPEEKAIKHFASLEPRYRVFEKGAIVARIYQMDKDLQSSCD